MAQNTKIEWCDHTVNLWWGCTKVHAGCDNCYAETLSHRWGNDVWGIDKPRKIIKSAFDDLAKYQRLAAKEGVIKRVFINSMSDIFEKPMPLCDENGEIITSQVVRRSQSILVTTAEIREDFFEGITKGDYPNLFFLLLTKRPSNINKYIPQSWKENPPANVMFGTSPVNQATANTLIPQLLQVKGRKFLSIEPQLDYIDLDRFLLPPNTDPSECIDWIIQGGESGPKRRPFNVNWARAIKGSCRFFYVPYFFKQIDKVLPIPTDLLIRQFPSF